MSTLKVTEIQSNSTSFNAPVLFETSGGTENGRLVKAWVNFNGQGTVSIRNDFNVNSVTDNTTGHYVINYSNNLATTTHCVTGNHSTDSGGVGNVIIGTASLSNTGQIRCGVLNAWADPGLVCVTATE